MRKSNLKTNISNARFSELYNSLLARELGDDPASLNARVGIVRTLEKACGYCFKDTRDMREKAARWLAGVPNHEGNTSDASKGRFRIKLRYRTGPFGEEPNDEED